MKVVIFCGGMGSRLKELSEEVPKPLIEVGGKPIVWHIMKIYASYGYKDFILCLGHKGHKIKEYFLDSHWRENNVIISGKELNIPESSHEDWKVTLVDTGENSTKAGRLLKIKQYLGDDEDFFVTYGDDVSDVNIQSVLDFHKNNKKIATLTAVRPVNPYGVINFEENLVTNFQEKPLMDCWTNGGFYVFSRRIFDYIQEGEELENEVFNKLVSLREISVYKHAGFWKGMNTFKENQELNNLWNTGKAVWKVWRE